MTYTVNHFISCFQTTPSSIAILDSWKAFVVLITVCIFPTRKLVHRFRYSSVFSVVLLSWDFHIDISVFDHFKQRFESSDTTW